MSKKERVTVTVDSELLQAGANAVAAGAAESLSAWVNRALLDTVSRERRLAAMAEAIAAYESDFGEISAAEMTRQIQADTTAAT